MARKTVNYTVEDKGRDHGKVFVITEMSAEDAEDWAMRALFALVNNKVDIGNVSPDMGMAGLAQIGFQALGAVDPATVKPLFKEMFACVRIMPTPHGAKAAVVRDLVPDDIEEVMTRVKLRIEIFKLHTDFFADAGPSLLSAVKKAAGQSVTATSRKR